MCCYYLLSLQATNWDRTHKRHRPDNHTIEEHDIEADRDADVHVDIEVDSFDEIPANRRSVKNFQNLPTTVFSSTCFLLFIKCASNLNIQF